MVEFIVPFVMLKINNALKWFQKLRLCLRAGRIISVILNLNSHILTLIRSVAIPVHAPKHLDHSLLPISANNLNDIFRKLILAFFVPNNIGPPAAKMPI